jgi:Tfp pilus assembly protein PilF/peroxiredoxin
VFAFSSGAEAPGRPAEFRLTPHYRTGTPLDAVLAQVQPGKDAFVSELYARRLEALLERWSAALRQSPADFQAIENSLAAGFRAASLVPTRERAVRTGADLEIFRREFSATAELAPEAFRAQLRDYFKPFAPLLAAEFQVTAIELSPAAPATGTYPSRLRTRVRYDLVGTGAGFHREQRTGYWEMEWQPEGAAEPRLSRWRPLEEVRSRAVRPLFEDVTARALEGNASYAAQLLRGADYWRTVLDAATGIDIYGHNGVAVGDFDNDGFDDVYVCQPAGLPNRLFRNRGDGTFEDVTESSGLGLLENTPCALFLDVTNRGRQDLIVVRADGPVLYLNQGNGRFERRPEAFRFAHPPRGTFTGAAAADYDRDGRLDLYFCLYLYYQGVDQYRYPSPYYDAENGPPNFLMHNEGDGTFRDSTSAAGLDSNNHRYSFCCGWTDFDQDGWPDLYVVNDFGRNNLYRNRGDGTFEDVARPQGVEDIGAGMSVCWLDYDRDGREDLYVGNMWTAAGLRVTAQDAFMKNAPERVRALYRQHAMGNALYRNRVQGPFDDTSAAAGVEVGRWAWSSDAWDFDLDGFPDLYIANGMVTGRRSPDLASFFWRQVVALSPAQPEPSHAYEQGWNAINELIRSDFTWNGFERNVLYANNRDGTFSDVSGAAGMDFVEDGRSFALADFDHDGRLEVFLKNRNGPQVRVLKNRMQELGAAIAFRLQGRRSPRDAIGAAITVEAGGRRQTRFLQAGSGFLSQHTKDVFFGLGKAQGPVEATIRWPSGLVQRLRGLPVGHLVSVEEDTEMFHVKHFAPSSPLAASPPPQGAPLPTRAETWLLAPVMAPEFSLPGLDGTARALSDFRGRPLLLNFWSAASPACGEELTGFQRHRAEWSARGLQLAALNLDPPENAAAAREFARARKISFPVLAASQDVAAIYNLLFRYLYDRHRDLPIPASFLLDAQGMVVKVYQGPADPGHVGADFLEIPRTPRALLAKALPFPGVTEATEFRRNYLSLGSVYYRRGYFDPAAAAFRLALGDDPESAEAYYGLGSVHLKQQNAGAAREAFQRAVKLRANYPDTLPNSWNNLGILAARQGQPAEALEDFQEALRINPHHLIALENLGNVYRQEGRWQEARRALERALAVNPQDAEANYSLGMVYAALDDAAQAHAYLAKALEVRPDYPEALNNLGVLYLRTGQRDEAVKSFETCMRVAPSFDQSYLNLAKLYALEGQTAQARAVLEELLKHRPGDARARQALKELAH